METRDPHRSASDRQEWRFAQASFPWQAIGLPPFVQWDTALVSAMRLIEGAACPMGLLFGPYGLLVANPVAQTLLAETENVSVAVRSIMDILPGSASFFAEVLKKAFAGEGLSFQSQPIRLIRNGGPTTAWFNLEFVPVADAEGKVLAILGSASEVTHQVRRVAELSASERRLRLALDGSGMVGVWALDVTSRIVVADALVARMYGLSPEECAQGIHEMHFIRVIHPDDRERVVEALREATDAHAPFRSRYRMVIPDQAVRWVIISATPAYDENNNLERFLGAVIDVTDQVEMAAALTESRFQFQILTEALPQIVWSCDGQGRHDYFSSRWSEFTGIAREDITEDTWKCLVYPEHWPMVEEIWQTSLRDGTPYDIDYRFRHHTGEYRWLRVMALPTRDDEGLIKRWFGSATDVHETYLVAGERERLAKELERIATEDHLTGVLTRRAFMARSTAALAAAEKENHALSLLMLDIDHFKTINDQNGHPAGDEVLQIVAKRIKASVKREDIVGRLGGEEFAIMLPECTSRCSRVVAERIRQAVADTPIELESNRAIRITVSIGVTARSDALEPLEALLSTADNALYNAKSAGRNCCHFSKVDRLQ